MSIRLGSKYIAGNMSLRLQDRIYTLRRTNEDGIEYYDVITPEGIDIDFSNNSRYLFFVDGTNLTTTPRVRLDSTVLKVKNNYTNNITIGDMIDGTLVEMYCITLSSGNIYMRSTATTYTELTEKPYINNVLLAGQLTPSQLGLAEYATNAKDDFLLRLGNKLFGSIEINQGTPDKYVLGATNADFQIKSTSQPMWYKNALNIKTIATTEDIANLVLPDNYKGSATYARITYVDMMNTISPVENETCFVTSENRMYEFVNDSWEYLFTVTPMNGDYFEISRFADDDTGRVTYNGSTEVWDYFKVRTIVYSDSLTYYDIILYTDNWVGKKYVIQDILLDVGDKILVYPAQSEDHTATIAVRNAFVKAQLTYVGDDIQDIVTLTADTVPEINLNVIVEVRK